MMKGILITLIGILITLYWTLIEKILYGWFVLPITNYPLTFWQLYGLSLFWSLWNYKFIYKDSGDDEIMARMYAEALVCPTLILFIGWTVKTFTI